MPGGRLHARPGTYEWKLAEALAWLWRIPGPVADAEAPDVAIGGPADARDLRDAVRTGRLAGAAIVGGGGSGEAPEDGLLVLGAGPEDWGSLAEFRMFPELARFLADTLARPLVLLPPIGCLRLDDAPGTAELQLRGTANRDNEERRRIATVVQALERSGARLVVAVAARALGDDGAWVPTDHIWPGAVGELAAGVRAGILEPACHGLTHLRESEHAAGHVDPREFLHVDEADAGRRLDEADAWMADRLGPARSFIAPAWGYSDGTLRAAAARGLPTWMPPGPGGLIDGWLVRETLHDGLPGLEGMDYAPLRELAGAGMPPTVVFHGRLLDGRLEDLRAKRDFSSIARLLRRRDLERIAALDGVTWVGAEEFVRALRAHEAIEPAEDGPRVPAGHDARLLHPT